MAVRRRDSRRRYYWPELQLNIWIIVVLSGSATCLGIFAWFMTVQAQMQLGTPWYDPSIYPQRLPKLKIIIAGCFPTWSQPVP